jgi:hypothetical protein
MKKIIFILVFMFICSLTNAEVYVLFNKSTSEIKDMSPENDAVVEKGYEKIILPGKISDYELQCHASYYKYKDKKFILNVKKISDEELAKQQQEERATEEKLIQDRITQIAVEELKKEGKVLKYH